VFAAAVGVAAGLWLPIPGFHWRTLPVEDQIAVVQQIDEGTDVRLLRNYGVVQQLDLLENYDLIKHLNDLRPASRSRHGMRS